MAPDHRITWLSRADVDEAVRLHLQLLDSEFITRAGPGFLRQYYLSWLRRPGGLGLAARSEGGSLAGLLLGAVRPGQHYREMLRGDGLRLGGALAVQSLRHPAFARELAVTRGARYTGALVRLAGTRLSRRAARPPSAAAPSPTAPPAPAPQVGEVTHLLVAPDRQGTGVGRALVDAALAEARRAGVDVMTLVTTAELAAQGFYERLGWTASGRVVSRSGEAFVRYEYSLDAGG